MIHVHPKISSIHLKSIECVRRRIHVKYTCEEEDTCKVHVHPKISSSHLKSIEYIIRVRDQGSVIKGPVPLSIHLKSIEYIIYEK